MNNFGIFLSFPCLGVLILFGTLNEMNEVTSIPPFSLIKTSNFHSLQNLEESKQMNLDLMMIGNKLQHIPCLKGPVCPRKLSKDVSAI